MTANGYAKVEMLNFSGPGRKRVKDAGSINLDQERGVAEGERCAKGRLQVSLFEGECDRFRKGSYEEYGVRGFCTEKFFENIMTSGIDYKALKPGDMLQIGDAVLEITVTGKKCYDECPLRAAVDECPMRTGCAFARVIKGAKIEKGERIKIIPKKADKLT